MLTATRASQLIDRIYGAGETGVGWEDCLDEIRKAVDGSAAHLLHYDVLTNFTTAVYSNFDPAAVHAYTTYFHKLAPWGRRRPARTVPDGHVLTGEDVLPHSELRKTEYYADFARPNGLTRVLVGMVGPIDRRCGVVVNRTDRQGNFDREDAELLSALLPHVRRALKIRERWVLAGQAQGAALDALDRLPFGVILVDGDGTVCHANTRARTLLARQDGIATSSGRVRGMTVPVTRQLRELCARIATTRVDMPRHPGAVLNLPRASSPVPLQVMVAPVHSRGPLTIPGRDVAAALYISDPTEAVVPDETLLRMSLDLTPAESRVATLLAAGRGVEEIREELSYTRETARWYIKQVLAKSGCRTRSEFAARAARSLAMLHAR